MKTLTLAAAVLTVLAMPALAEPDCRAAKDAKPMWEVVKSFEEGESAIVDIAKVTGDKCYEIYGHAGTKKLEIYYDPATGAVLDREED